IVGVGRTRNAIPVLDEDRLELAGIAGVEAVEIVETQSAGPMIERTDLAGFPGGRVVVLSDPRGCIAVLPEDFRDGASALRNDARVAVITGRQFRDDAVPGDMMVAPREQRGARRRAQGGRMEARVAQALRSQLVDIG